MFPKRSNWPLKKFVLHMMLFVLLLTKKKMFLQESKEGGRISQKIKRFPFTFSSSFFGFCDVWTTATVLLWLITLESKLQPLFTCSKWLEMMLNVFPPPYPQKRREHPHFHVHPIKIPSVVLISSQLESMNEYSQILFKWKSSPDLLLAEGNACWSFPWSGGD